MNEQIQKFKTNAWQSSGMAENYKKNVNTFSDYQDFLVDIYLSSFVNSNPNLDAQLLDLGCGTGILFSRLAQMGYRVDGLDVSKEMLMQIPRNFDSNRCRLYQGDIFNLSGFNENYYDAVFSRWVFPHFRNWVDILKSIRGAIKPSGLVYFDMTLSDNYSYAKEKFKFSYNNYVYDDRTDNVNVGKYYASASPQEIESVCKDAGFELVELTPASFFYANPIFSTDIHGNESYGRILNFLNTLVKTNEGREFFDFFEKNITPNLPLKCSNVMRVTARKT